MYCEKNLIFKSKLNFFYNEEINYYFLNELIFLRKIRSQIKNTIKNGIYNVDKII